MNPPKSTLADALRGLLKLLDDGDLVRNTDGDADQLKFMRQGTRIMFALQAAQNALESENSTADFKYGDLVDSRGTRWRVWEEQAGMVLVFNLDGMVTVKAAKWLLKIKEPDAQALSDGGAERTPNEK